MEQRRLASIIFEWVDSFLEENGYPYVIPEQMRHQYRLLVQLTLYFRRMMEWAYILVQFDQRQRLQFSLDDRSGTV